MRSLLLRFRPWSRLLAALTAGLLTVGRAPAAVAQCSLPPPTVNASTPLCEGGMLILLSSGVPMGADYLWTGPNGFTATRANPRVPNITGAGSGYYKLQITFNGCTSADSVNVAVQARPTVTITASGPTTICQGGSVTLTASGAASYVWSTGASTPSITVTQSGNYAVTGFSTNNCSGTAGPINVNVVAAPTISIAASGPTSFCQGGSVVLTATVAPGSATVLWSTGATGLSITVTQSGTYSATASRANGCSVPSNPLSVRVSALPTPTLAASGPTTFCAGGFVTLTATGGGTYQWSNGATTASITVTQSGMYSATVTNAQGCSAPTGSIRVTVQPAPTITIAASGSPALCQGSTLTLTATASPNSSIRWSNGAMGPSITVGNAGTYSATARFPNGANSCSTTSSPITVTVAPAPTVSVSASGATTFCQGGSVTLTASGATTYQWSTGATTATISVTTSGSYSVMGTASGCAATSAPVTVTVNPAPAALTTADASHCGPGALTLTASAAPAGATYQWYTTATGGTPLSGVTGGTFTTPTLSATTTYYVSARSGAGCEGPRTPVTATINALPTATIAASGPTTFCAGGSVTLTAPAAAGYSYRWSTGATTATITVNTSGSYSVTVTTAASCSATSAATTITINPAPLALAATGASRCGPGAVTLTASGAPTGATYRWYPMATGGTPLSGVTGGTFTTPTLSATTTYYVSARSGAGCEGPRTPVTATINAPPTATIAASGPTTFCAGDSVPLTASGGGTYRWSTGATTPTISVSTSGAYSVTVTNAAGCSATSPATTITVNPRASAAFAYATSTFCLNGAANPVPTIAGAAGGTFGASPGGLILNPTTGQITLSGSTAGTYVVTYAVGGGACPARQTQTVTLTTAPASQFSYAGGPFCAGAGALLTPTLAAGSSIGTVTTPSAGLALTAASGVIDLRQSQPGIYTLTNTIAAAGTCAAVATTTTLTILAAPTVTVAASGPTTFCQGGTVTLTAFGGSSYRWSTGATTPSISVSSSGTYSVTATSAAGCTAISAPLTVTVNPGASAAFTYPAATYCLGAATTPTATISGTVGGTFAATPAGLSLNSTTGAVNLAGSQAGTYTITYAATGPCPAQQTATLTLSAAPTAQFGYAAGPYCAGSTGTIAATLGSGAAAGTFTASPAGLRLNPATGAVDLSQSAAGTYTVINQIAASGCPAASASATLTIMAAPAATVTAGGPTAFCQGGSVTLTASGATTYLWSTGATTATISVSTSGSYTVMATNAAGCPATSAALTVTVNPLPGAPVVTQQTQGSRVLLTASTTTGNQWYRDGVLIAGATGATYLATQTGSYTVVTTVASGCASDPSAAVSVIITAVTAEQAAATLQLFPNPASHVVHLTLAAPAPAGATVRMLDAVGRVVRTGTFTAGATNYELFLTDVPAGVYTVRYGATTRRLVVE